MEIKTDKSFLETKQFKKLKLLDACINDIKDDLLIKPEIKIMGKVCKQNRDVNFYSNFSKGYNYSGQFMKSKNLTVNLEKLLNKINKIYNSNFNSILINRYNDGKDYIGKHTDNEKTLDNIGVISLSSGASRIFRVRNKNTNEIIKDINLTNGLLCQMGGDFQNEFTHEIPKQLKINDCRYSFTFRKHLI